MFKPVKCPPGCVYSMVAGGATDGVCSQHCGFILYTGQLRGCDPGPGCTRYRTGRRCGSIPGVQAVVAEGNVIRPDGTIRRAGGRKFTWDEQAGKRMWLEGKTDRQIADALGIRRDTVGDCRRRKWMKEERNARRKNHDGQ